MSTWLYLECRSHEPPLQSDSESGQHLTDLPQIRQDYADREALLRARDSDNPPEFGYFTQHTLWFLAQHRACEIGLRDEYGREHPLVGEEASA